MAFETVKLKINPNDDADVDLIRVMAAVNDMQRALRCMIAEIKPPEGMPLCAYDKDTRGYYSYFGRLACGHLHEGLVAFRRFCIHQKVKRVAEKLSSSAKSAFENLLAASDPTDPSCFFKKESSNLRSETAFHYPPKEFKEQISLSLSGDPAHKVIPEIIAGSTHAETFYRFADDIIAKLFMKQGNYDSDETGELLKKIRQLQFDLIMVVDEYLAAADMVFSDPK